MDNNKITFVSLGPGDPELITLKGLKALQNADIILCPATSSKQGATLSRALNIISSLEIDSSKAELFIVPMSRDRERTLQVYNDIALRSVDYAKKGKRVAITAEGDAGFYSSAQYIEEFIWTQGYPTQRISGVPAFIDCATRSATHLINQDSSFEVIARVDSAEQLLSAMKQNKSIVLMKVSQWEDAIKQVIQQSEEHNYYYVESAGVSNKEFISSDKSQILERKFPYFAILIIKRK